MQTIGISIDYSNICKDYNTAYLDRDNTDPATNRCMKQVIEWTRKFLADLMEHFNYNIYPLNSITAVKIEEVAAKRFLFYSLEKEITLQSFVLDKEHQAFENIASWEANNQTGLLIQNDKDGEGLYLYLKENSDLHYWINERLKNFSVDDVPFIPNR